jgi:hypothetical protein
MTIEEQIQIANTFSDKFQEFDIGLTFKADEFKQFDNGIFANDMDDKWNIFVLDNFMYWVRSWTDYCIYKIQLIRQDDNITLQKGFVTREKSQYNSVNLDKDKILFLQLLQIILNRDDIYVDPEFELEIIKEIISKLDPNSKCIKSIGHGNNVGLTKNIYDGLTTHSKNFCEVIGWQELRKELETKNDNEDLLSLYLQDKDTKKATTFYFDKEGKLLLGQVTVIDRHSSS